MTIDEITNTILDNIEKIYDRKYIGKIDVKRINPIGISVTLSLNNVDKPLVIAAELNDNDFIKFFNQELHDRGLNTVKYFMGVKSYPDNGQPVDNTCNCK